MHDPQVNPTFYELNKNIVTLFFGERSYEEICKIHKNYKDLPGEGTFQEYLSHQKIRNFWEDHFLDQKKQEPWKKKKKKKSRGTIPI